VKGKESRRKVAISLCVFLERPHGRCSTSTSCGESVRFGVSTRRDFLDSEARRGLPSFSKTRYTACGIRVRIPASPRFCTLVETPLFWLPHFPVKEGWEHAIQCGRMRGGGVAGAAIAGKPIEMSDVAGARGFGYIAKSLER
jgi:hypothetical protein